MTLESDLQNLVADIYLHIAKSTSSESLKQALQLAEATQAKISAMEDRILRDDFPSKEEIQLHTHEIQNIRERLRQKEKGVSAESSTQERQLIDFAKTPELIEAQVSYGVKVGDFVYKVQFSEQMVRDVFRNPFYAAHARKVMSAILNGFNTSASAYLKLVVSQKWIVQTSIMSKDLGTFRMYGVKKDEAIFFEKYIDKSNHSAEWLQVNLAPAMADYYFEHFGKRP